MTASKQEQQFVKLFLLSMLIFLLVTAMQAFTLELVALPLWGQVIVSLTPILPLIWSFKIFLNHYRGLDEYLKALTGEAFLWTLAILCFASFAYGLLKMQFPIPDFNLAFILPTVFGAHGLILQVLLWKDNENKMKVMRAERNWSQQVLADKLGVSRQAVNAIEREKHDPSLQLAFDIAKAFDTQIELVFLPAHIERE